MGMFAYRSGSGRRGEYEKDVGSRPLWLCERAAARRTRANSVLGTVSKTYCNAWCTSGQRSRTGALPYFVTSVRMWRVGRLQTLYSWRVGPCPRFAFCPVQHVACAVLGRNAFDALQPCTLLRFLRQELNS